MNPEQVGIVSICVNDMASLLSWALDKTLDFSSENLNTVLLNDFCVRVYVL